MRVSSDRLEGTAVSKLQNSPAACAPLSAPRLLQATPIITLLRTVPPMRAAPRRPRRVEVPRVALFSLGRFAVATMRGVLRALGGLREWRGAHSVLALCV